MSSYEDFRKHLEKLRKLETTDERVWDSGCSSKSVSFKFKDNSMRLEIMVNDLESARYKHLLKSLGLTEVME
jgi:hypothetical protein